MRGRAHGVRPALGASVLTTPAPPASPRVALERRRARPRREAGWDVTATTARAVGDLVDGAGASAARSTRTFSRGLLAAAPRHRPQARDAAVSTARLRARGAIRRAGQAQRRLPRALGDAPAGARCWLEQRAADATAAEEARGAGLTNFGMLVTATRRPTPSGSTSARRAVGQTRFDGAHPAAPRLRLAGQRVRRRTAAGPRAASHLKSAASSRVAVKARRGKPAPRLRAVRAAGRAAAAAHRATCRPPRSGAARPCRSAACGRSPRAPARRWSACRSAATCVSGATLCCGPDQRGSNARKLISNPSLFVLGLPGLGKSHARPAHGARPRRLRRDAAGARATSSPTTSTSSRRSAARSSSSAAAAAT